MEGLSDLTFWHGKRVFVTGHTGFKGSWMCEILLRAGADVTGYSLKPSAEPNLFDICKPAVHSIFGDIRDFPRLSGAFEEMKPEIVIHMAAQPLVLESYKNPVYTYETNVMGTVNVLECVRNVDCVRSFLNVTTDKVYFNSERREGYSEDEQLGGFDPYANSKSCSEFVTASYKNSFLDARNIAVSTARSGNVIGGGDFAENRLIPDCARAALGGMSIMIRNPNAIRPYQHVLDTLLAYLLIVEKQHENPAYAGCYNIGPEQCDCKTSAELATLFCDSWGDGLSWDNVAADSPHESSILRLDCSKIAQTFRWKPVWNIEVAVRETVNWYREYEKRGEVVPLMMRQIDEFVKSRRY